MSVWKWIGGCLVVALVVIAVGSYWGYKGYQNFTSRGGAASVTIAATPDRVFASLATGDSVSTWMERGARVTVTSPGLLAAGDSIHVESRSGRGGEVATYTWIVTEVVPPRLLVLEMARHDTSSFWVVRRDSLVQVGDSTTIISTADVKLDSAAQAGDPSRQKGAQAVTDMSSRFALSMMRVQLERELEGLKERIEGTATSPPPVPDSLR